MLKFGTSGIRGLVTEFTDHEIHLLTTAFLTHARTLGQDSLVAVAQDLRESSPRIAAAVLEAIHAFGLPSRFCGALPTPALAYYAQQQKSLAIMVTGSHIPADRNGIKFYLESGETLKADDEAIYKIYLELKKQNHPQATPAPTLKTRNAQTEARELYLQRYLRFFPQAPLKGFKLLFYQHSSVARDLFPEILEKLGAEVLRLGRSEVFIPVDTEAVDAVDSFKAWIQEHNADALISTDGDADRPLFVDARGQVLPGDKLGALTSLYLGCEAIALPVSCNSAIAEVPAFKKVVSTKIGSPYVIEALNHLAQEYPQVAGFEANGGFILKSKVSKNGQSLESLATRDAVLPVLCVLALAKEKRLPLAEVGRLLPQRFTASGLIKNFPTERSQGILNHAKENPDAFLKKLLPQRNLEVQETNPLDGLRCHLQGNLVVHLRPSGNAPEFRCYTEAPSQTEAEALCREVLGQIQVD